MQNWKDDTAKNCGGPLGNSPNEGKMLTGAARGEGSIWSNKGFSNGVLNILRHALRVLSVQLLKANNASHFLLSISCGTAMMDLIN